MHLMTYEYPNYSCPDSINYFGFIAGTSISLLKEEKEVILPTLIPMQEQTEFSLTIKTQKDIEKIKETYTFENSKDVERFILNNNYLIEILFKIPYKVKEIFGEIANLCLELHQDPEEDFEGLFVIIKTNLSPEESLDLLDKFDEEWWLDVDNSISNILGVTVEPI